MEQCPSCGAEVGVVAFKVNLVKIETHKCHCGRLWRRTVLIGPFMVNEAADEVKRLLRKFPSDKPMHVRMALDFLQAKVEDHARSALDRDSQLRQRRNDNWERRFLREAIGEDYPDDKHTGMRRK